MSLRIGFRLVLALIASSLLWLSAAAWADPNPAGDDAGAPPPPPATASDAGAPTPPSAPSGADDAGTTTASPADAAALADASGGATVAATDTDGGAPPGPTDDGGAGEGSSLATVTVTAQRRANTVQKTPISITAFSQDAIKQQQIATFRDLSGKVPGLLAPLTSTAQTTQTYSMRGIGEIDTYPEPSVAVYIDDVYLARTVGSIYDTPDLERVEVLRGPQGTLYGRNSAAGAIRFITKDPTAERTFSLDVALGNYENVDVKARANGAVLPDDALNVSVSVVRHQRQGYTYDVPMAQWVNNLDLWVARTKLKSVITDRLTSTLSLDAMWDRSTATYYTPVNQPNGVPSGNPTDPSVTYSNTIPYNQTTVYGGSLTFRYELTDALTLKLVSAVRGMHGPIYYDNDGTTFIKGDSYAGFNENYETEELSINGDFDKLNFVGGVYYFNEFFHNDRVNQAAAAPVNNFGIIQHDDSRLYTQSYAGFGQADYKITKALAATLGARYTADIRSFTNFGQQQNNTPLVYPLPGNFNPNLFGNLFGPGSTTFLANAPTKTFGAFTPKVGLQLQATDDVLTYASFSQGFKSGGYDLRATTLNGSLTPYKPETITTYEAGIKSAFLDNHVTANLAAYFNHIDDFQARATSYGALGTPVNSLINTGNAHSYGGELELALNPFKGFVLSGSGAYLQTGYDTFNNTLPPNVAGRTTLVGLQFALAPTWQASFAANWTVPISMPGRWRIGADVPYESGHFLDIYNTAQLHVGAQAFLNGILSYTSESESWSAGFTGNNILNLRRFQGGGYAPANAGANPLWYYAYNPPRMLNLFFNWKI